MGCLSKLDKAVLMNCDNGATGIEEMLLINVVDIATKAVAAGVATLTLTSGTKAVLVESNKKGVNATQEIKVNDNAPTALTDAVTFTVYNKDAGSADIINKVLNGKFTAVAKMRENNVYRVYGLAYGLEASAVTEEANANGGYTSITLTTPENSFGEQRATVTAAAYTTLRSTAIIA